VSVARFIADQRTFHRVPHAFTGAVALSDHRHLCDEQLVVDATGGVPVPS
jgi:hypothetical protein